MVARRLEATSEEVIELRKLSPKVTGGLLRARDATYADGALPAKHKVLTALAISVAIRCEPCIEMYVEKAVEKAATLGELVEALEVAMTMQGCPGEAWAQKALKVYRKLQGKAPEGLDLGEETNPCCPH